MSGGLARSAAASAPTTPNTAKPADTRRLLVNARKRRSNNWVPGEGIPLAYDCGGVPHSPAGKGNAGWSPRTPGPRCDMLCFYYAAPPSTVRLLDGRFMLERGFPGRFSIDATMATQRTRCHD